MDEAYPLELYVLSCILHFSLFGTSFYIFKKRIIYAYVRRDKIFLYVYSEIFCVKCDISLKLPTNCCNVQLKYLVCVVFMFAV